MKVVESELKWAVRLENRFLSLATHFLLTFNYFNLLSTISDRFLSLSINFNIFNHLYLFPTVFTQIQELPLFLPFLYHFQLFRSFPTTFIRF